MTRSQKHADTAREGEATRHERVFVDRDGAQWQVKEMPFSDYDRRNGLSLIFWSDGAVRRVRDYPTDWYQLSDDELMRLSWKV